MFLRHTRSENDRQNFFLFFFCLLEALEIAREMAGFSMLVCT